MYMYMDIAENRTLGDIFFCLFRGLKICILHMLYIKKNFPWTNNNSAQ